MSNSKVKTVYPHTPKTVHLWRKIGKCHILDNKFLRYFPAKSSMPDHHNTRRFPELSFNRLWFLMERKRGFRSIQPATLEPAWSQINASTGTTGSKLGLARRRSVVSAKLPHRSKMRQLLFSEQPK